MEITKFFLGKEPSPFLNMCTSFVYLYFGGAIKVKMNSDFIRGSPIGFSGSGIWLISRPGFGILKRKGDKIRDCNYNWDKGFGDFNRRESGNVAAKKPRFRNSRD